MALEFRDPSTGKIKSWVWIAAALGLAALMFLVSKGSAGGSSNTTTDGTPVGTGGGATTDYSGQLQAIQDSINALGTSNVPPSNGNPPNPNPTNPIDINVSNINSNTVNVNTGPG